MTTKTAKQLPSEEQSLEDEYWKQIIKEKLNIDEIVSLVRKVQAEAWEEGHNTTDYEWTGEPFTKDRDLVKVINPYLQKGQR